MNIPALDPVMLREQLADVINELTVVERTGSTNADLVAAARSGAADRTVLVAELQDAGRGRLARSWTSPPRAGLTFSVLWRPGSVPTSQWGWLPLLVGVSLVHTVRELTEVDVALKWPNDLLAGPRRAKCAGLLAEVAEPGAVVFGVGLNVWTAPGDLPEGVNATSLSAEGARVARDTLLVALLRRMVADESTWRAAEGDPDATGLRERYRAACATVGCPVRLDQPGGAALLATAVDIDRAGRLVLRDRDGDTRAVAAGDVVHLRAIT